MVQEPIGRRKEWERSRSCGWEIDLGVDSVAGRLVPGADFNYSQRDFSAVFQENFRAENEKRGSDLMCLYFDAYIMLGLIEFQWCIAPVGKVKPGGAH